MEQPAQAVFERRDDPDVGRVFVIAVEDAGAPEQTLVLAGRGAPGPETYTVDDTDRQGGGYILRKEAESQVAYIVEAGTFTLTYVEADRIEGRFELNATRFLAPEVGIAVHGTFEAALGEVPYGK